MVNPQLIDYIKQQLAQGLSKEVIQQNLISGGGWNFSDISEAFSIFELDQITPDLLQVNPQTIVIKSRVLLYSSIIFLVVTLLATLLFGYSEKILNAQYYLLLAFAVPIVLTGISLLITWFIKKISFKKFGNKLVISSWVLIALIISGLGAHFYSNYIGNTNGTPIQYNTSMYSVKIPNYFRFASTTYPTGQKTNRVDVFLTPRKWILNIDNTDISKNLQMTEALGMSDNDFMSRALGGQMVYVNSVNPTYVSTSTTMIDGVQANVVNLTYTATTTPSETFSQEWAVFFKNGHMWGINIIAPESDFQESVAPIIPDIFDSFKDNATSFASSVVNNIVDTNFYQTPGSDWQIYGNKQFNLSFMYPSAMKISEITPAFGFSDILGVNLDSTSSTTPFSISIYTTTDSKKCGNLMASTYLPATGYAFKKNVNGQDFYVGTTTLFTAYGLIQVFGYSQVTPICRVVNANVGLGADSLSTSSPNVDYTSILNTVESLVGSMRTDVQKTTTISNISASVSSNTTVQGKSMSLSSDDITSLKTVVNSFKQAFLNNDEQGVLAYSSVASQNIKINQLNTAYKTLVIRNISGINTQAEVVMWGITNTGISKNISWGFVKENGLWKFDLGITMKLSQQI